MMRLNRRGQNVIEYTVLVALVAAAIIAMRNYVYRSAQATLKMIEDQINDDYEPEG